MPPRTRRTELATDRARADLLAVCRDIRAARLAHGLRQVDVGRSVGRSGTEVGRIERGRIPGVELVTLARMASSVGLELRLRAYPGGHPIRDRAHLELLARLRRRIHPDLRWRTEVPLPLRGDRRAWDATIGGRGWEVGVDAETRPNDVQALVRRVALMRRDAGIETVVLLLAATRHVRTLVGLADQELTSTFPVDGGAALARLAAGDHPGGSAVILL